jgi:hypothetical protein
MKSLIRKQSEVIESLSASGKKSWFSEQVDSLGMKNIDSAKRTQLSDQFNVLKAGYKSSGQEVDDALIFEQASKLVLGDELKAQEDAQKGEKLKKRAKLQTARPIGPAVKAKGDPLDIVAQEIDREIFGKR